MPRKLRPSMLALLTALGVAGGVAGAAFLSAERLSWRTVAAGELSAIARLEPIRALPRTEAVLVAMEARRYLDAGRPWAAWDLLRQHTADPEAAIPSLVVLAARAAGEWGGWSHARLLLADQPWLERAEGGEGLFLLGRAEEELGNLEEAAVAYRRYTALERTSSRGVALGRLGRVLREQGEEREAAEAFAAAGAATPEIEDWLLALQVEQLAAAGHPDVARLATTYSGGSAPVRMRRTQAEAAGWAAAGDLSRAVRRLDWESRILKAQGARVEAAELHLARATLLLDSEDAAEARELLRGVAWETSLPAALRLRAAEMLDGVTNRTAEEELARAAGFEAGGKPGLAARAVRAAREAGAPDDAALRLRLARLLYEERDHGPAATAFERAAEVLTDRELKADAELHAARSLFRSGVARNRSRAIELFRRVAERHEGTAAAGTALFLLGDVASTTEAGLAYYRRAAAVEHSPDAREALYRVGDRGLRLDDTAGAIRAWEEYVRRYPTGEQTARVAYETGRLHERAGREPSARAMYTAATLADPVAYYAMRAGDRLGLDPVERVAAEPRPWVGLAADPADAAAALRRLDALDRMGLREEWDAEYRAVARAFEDRPVALLVLGEGLRDRGHALEGIRIGSRLRAARGDWDARLLRLAFPFPYRELIRREAERQDVDPMLLAGLIRQESTFRPAVKSWVGATGLGQIMPATGRWLAGSMGLRGYEEKLLEVPEVNARMAATYLGDLLDRYDGARDLALAAYNAGPGRADRWKREFRYGRDIDAFREQIPFDETRNYVKVVLRNAAVYERLYGDDRDEGLVRGE